MTESIVLKQLPIIAHKLQEVGKSVEARLQELNIDNLVATEETVKAIKKMAAELNKELGEYEEQRKMISKAINAPYDAFNTEYKVEVFERYTKAIEKLKNMSTSVEFKIKEAKQKEVQLYFDELCQSENIDFLKFSHMGMDINLSTTEKAYKEKVNEFVTRVKDDIALIGSQEHQVEIMAEYKTCLSASKAITTITDRKTRERLEKERIKQQEWSRRKSALLNIAMPFHTTTNVFAFNEQIYVSADKVEKSTNGEFDNLVIWLQQQIKDTLKPINGKVVEYIKEPEPIQEPIKAPVVEEKLEIVTASFEVKGTYPALKALGEYMRNNNITYKNI